MVRDNNIRIRIFKNRLLYVLVCVLSGLTAIPLLAILGEVLIKGWKQLGWSFITEATPNAYKAMQAVSAGQDIPGGIANGIVGTFLMLMLAAVVAIPVGVFCGICLSEYRKNWFATIVSYLTDLLQGTPSIIKRTDITNKGCLYFIYIQYDGCEACVGRHSEKYNYGYHGTFGLWKEYFTACRKPYARTL